LDWSIWTSYFYDLPLSRALMEFRSLDFNFLELSAEHMSELVYNVFGEEFSDLKSIERLNNIRDKITDIGMENIRDLMNNLDIEFIDVHGPFDVSDLFPKSFVNWIDRAVRKLVKWFNICGELNIPVIVLHPIENVGLEVNVEYFRRLSKIAAEYGVKIAVENYGYLHNFYSRINNIVETIIKVGSDSLGICLDTGHANIEVYTGRVDESIYESNGYLLATHVSDNDGLSDQHLFPGKGIIDWKKVFKAFKEIKFSKPLNLEVPGETRYSLEERKEYLNHFISKFNFI